jgi:hypothetical protein
MDSSISVGTYRKIWTVGCRDMHIDKWTDGFRSIGTLRQANRRMWR